MTSPNDDHADDCPAVGGDGGMYRVLAEIHPKWRAWCRPGVCNCGRFYPSKPVRGPRVRGGEGDAE